MARKKATPSLDREMLEPRVYEVGFLLSPAIREEDLDARTDEIRDIITNAGGTIISEAKPEFIDLAYEMARVIDNKRVRFTQGYFGWIKFTAAPNLLADIKIAIEKKIFLIRMIMINTVAENTVISKKPLSKVLKSSARAVVSDEIPADDIVADADIDDIDPGMAAVELQTPVNEINEDVVEDISTDEPEEEVE